MFGRREQTKTAGEERNTGITSQSKGQAASTAESVSHGAVTQGTVTQGAVTQGAVTQGTVTQSAESQSAESRNMQSGSTEPRGIAATVAEALAQGKPAQDKAQAKSAESQAESQAKSAESQAESQAESAESQAQSKTPSEAVATATPANCDGAARAPRPAPKVPEAPAQTKTAALTKTGVQTRTAPRITPGTKPALSVTSNLLSIHGFDLYR